MYEIMDNSIDEAMAGFCNKIRIIINKDNSITNIDNGRGVPVGIHPKMGVSTVEVVHTILHAGGKFDTQGYKVSGGLHGVGAAVVNALSEYMVVEVFRDGKIYRQRYERGIVMSDLEVVGQTDITGTKTTFLPDTQIFDEVEFDFEILLKRFRELAFLNKGLKIILRDERPDEPIEKELHYEGGIVSFVEYLDRNKNPLHEPIYYNGSREDSFMEIAMQYNKDTYTENIHSFVNNISTIEGGTHLTGFKAAITKVLNDYGRKFNLIKENEKNLLGEDVREGLTAVISIKLSEPQFEGQTKTKLGNSEVRGFVESIVTERFLAYLEENPAISKLIIDKCMESARAREAARKARELTRRKSVLESSTLPGKLADCSKRIPPYVKFILLRVTQPGDPQNREEIEDFRQFFLCGVRC